MWPCSRGSVGERLHLGGLEVVDHGGDPDAAEPRDQLGGLLDGLRRGRSRTRRAASRLLRPVQMTVAPASPSAAAMPRPRRGSRPPRPPHDHRATSDRVSRSWRGVCHDLRKAVSWTPLDPQARTMTATRLGTKILAAVGLVLAVLVADRLMSRHSAERRLAELNQLADRMRAAPSDPVAFRELASVATDKDEWTRSKAFAAMTVIGYYPGVPPAAMANIREILVPAVRVGLRDRNGFVRREAAKAAASFAGGADLLKRDLIEAVKAYPNQDVGWFSATALGNVGPSARDAVPTLQTALNQISWGREFVEEAIRKISGLPFDGGAPTDAAP